jgi:HAD superfamily hydrolase (TIGR01509 family)
MVRARAEKTTAAVICDFDNTLVDSERMNAELFAGFFEQFGVVHSDAADLAYVDGAPFVSVVRYYQEKYRGSLGQLTEAELIDSFLRYKAQQVASRTVPSATGVTALLELPLPKAIVSGSFTAEIEAVARAARLPLDAFELVLGSDQYYPWKPNPAGLLQAANRLGVQVDGVDVLEDSVSGLAAAASAGMTPVAIEQFSEADPYEIERTGAVRYTTVAEYVKTVSGGQ